MIHALRTEQISAYGHVLSTEYSKKLANEKNGSYSVILNFILTWGALNPNALATSVLHPVIQLNYEVDIHILRPTNQALGKI